MEPLSEDENKHDSSDVQPTHDFTPPQPPPSSFDAPPPPISAPVSPQPLFEPIQPQSSAAPQAPSDNHNTHAVTIIIQWLTYAFWGWTVLILAILTGLVFAQLLNDGSSSNANYYVISAAIVLLPVSFATDFFYSKREPKKKEGAAMVVMVIHAVIFALFGIGAVIYAVFSFVSLLTSSGSHTDSYVSLWSALFIAIFYAATFIRTINPVKLAWIPKAYKIFMVFFIVLFIILGFLKIDLNSHEQLNTKGARRPSQYTHICATNDSNDITYVTQGSPKCLGDDSYQSDYDASVPGLLYSSPCKTTSGKLRYVYIAENEACPDNTKLVFYNTVCPEDATSSDDCTGQSSSSSSPSTSPSTSSPANNISASGTLEPSVVGGTLCDIPTLADGSTTGQAAISGGATCDDAEANIQSANGKEGSSYTSGGYSCTSTKQGANTQWSSYWNNNFYSYNCTSGSKQTAFNIQTTAQSSTSSSTLTD